MAVGVVLLLPVLVVVVRWTGQHWLPVQDLAVIDLRTRDVWSWDLPLVGPYSRNGWNHPGPWTYWVLAVLGLPFGQPAWITLVGSALLQGSGIAAVAVLAWRRGRLALLLIVGAGVALSYRGLGGWAVLEPWNPHVAFAFFPLFLLLVWDVVTGHARSLIAAAVVGSFLVQTHIGYSPLVGGLGLWVLLLLWRDHRGRPDADAGELPLRRVVTTSAVVAAVMWLPAVVETVVNPPGNGARIARFFLTNPDDLPVTGPQDGLGLLASQFRFLPPWLGGPNLGDVGAVQLARPASLAWLVVPVVLLGLGFLAVRRTRSRPQSRALGMATVLFVLSAVALSRVAGPVEPYLFYWRLTTAVVVVVAVGAAVADAARVAQRPALARVLGGALAAALVWGSVWLALDAARDVGMTRFSPTAARVIDQIERRDLPSEPVLVRAHGSALLGLEAAIIDELDRRGVQVRVDDDRAIQFGDHRVADADDVDEVWLVVEEGWLISDLLAAPGARIVARASPLDEADEAALVAAQQAVAASLRAVGREDLLPQLDSPFAGFTLADVPSVDRDALEILVALNDEAARRRNWRVAVVAIPPS